MESFSKPSIEQLVGGNGGVFVGDYVSGYISGKMLATGNKAAVVSTLVKALGGAACMALGEKVRNDSNEDAGNVLIGFGVGPIMTIANDWYKAVYGVDPKTGAAARAARAKVASPRARNMTVRQGPSTNGINLASTVGVF